MKKENIIQFDFVKKNNEYYCIIRYENSKEEKVSVKKALQTIKKISNDKELKEKFRSTRKNLIVAHELTKNNALKEITYNNFKEEYDNYLKNKKEKQKDIENKSNIGKIVLYDFEDENKEKRTCAVIFYTDGEVKNVSEEEAIVLMNQYMSANNLDKEEIGKLFEKGIFQSITGEKLIKNFRQYREEATTTKKEKRIWKKFKEKKANFYKKHPFLSRTIAICTPVIIALGSLITISKTHLNKKELDPKESETTQSTENTEIKEENMIIEDPTDLISKCKSTKRREVFTKTYNFLRKYNIDFANKYKEGKTNKPAHTVDEVTAMYITYNDLTDAEINEIYNKADFDKDSLIYNITSAQYMDAISHNIQKNSFGKASLFNNKKDKELYKKYEQLFINMNKTTDYNTKKNIKEKFFDMIRSDLPGMQTNDYTNVSASKIVLREFMFSMQNITIPTDNELSSAEKDYINGILDHVVEEKFDKIIRNKSAKEKADEVTSNYSYEGIDLTDPNYNYFKQVVQESLEKENAYSVEDRETYIGDYTAFIKNTKIAMPSQDMQNNNTEEKEQKEQKNTAHTSQNKPVENNSNNKSVTEEAIQPEKKLERKIESIITPEREQNIDRNMRKEKVDIKNTKPEDLVTPSIELEDFPQENTEKNDVTNILDEGIENYNPDDVIDVITPEEIEDNQYEVEIDEDKQDEFGNLSDEYIDLSPEPIIEETEIGYQKVLK